MTPTTGCTFYRVTPMVVFGSVDFKNFSCSTTLPCWPAYLSKFPSAQAEGGRQRNDQYHSQPNPQQSLCKTSFSLLNHWEERQEYLHMQLTWQMHEARKRDGAVRERGCNRALRVKGCVKAATDYAKDAEAFIFQEEEKNHPLTIKCQN